MDKQKMRQKNLLYKLRQKGVRCFPKERIIIYPVDGNPFAVVQIRRLCEEYGFKVQLTLW